MLPIYRSIRHQAPEGTCPKTPVELCENVRNHSTCQTAASRLQSALKKRNLKTEDLYLSKRINPEQKGGLGKQPESGEGHSGLAKCLDF